MKIVERLKQLAEDERALIAECVQLLLVVEDKKIFARLGHASVYDFCIRELGYSEGATVRRVNAMRLQRKDPRCVALLASGELSLTNASNVQAALREAGKRKQKLEARTVVDAVLGLTTKQAEKKLNEFVPQEKRARLPLSLEEKLAKLRTLLPRELQAATNDELLHFLLDQALEKYATPQGDIASDVQSPEKRHVPKKLRAAIFARDKHQCTYPGCQAKQFLDVDHVKPIAHGGLTIPENLRVLCHTHNLLVAEEMGLKRPS